MNGMAGGATLWWLLAGALVAAELLTGTFYLLMLGLGAVAGALVSHAGLSVTVQLLAAAAVAAGATAAWHLQRRRRPAPAIAAAADRDVNLDIGQTLTVAAWAADRTARVPYRGAQWTVVHAGTGMPLPGLHRIVAVQGSRLVVAPAADA